MINQLAVFILSSVKIVVSPWNGVYTTQNCACLNNNGSEGLEVLLKMQPTAVTSGLATMFQRAFLAQVMKAPLILALHGGEHY